jgi:hypothetical protein
MTSRSIITCAVLVVTAGVLNPAVADDSLFRDKVAPVLASRCVRCHGGSATKGGLSLRSLDSIKAGGESGPAIAIGDPDGSLLVEKIAGPKPEMPKGGAPLNSEDVTAIRQWIRQGAPWPRELVLAEPSEHNGPWWAVQPLQRPAVPRVNAPEWIRTPIDAFILNALEGKQLKPSREADRRTLIRRLSYDLLGLPPTPEEVDSFVNDPNPAAYERLVDRLLASPHHGERWGRHWLDVMHYGDTHGYDKDKRRDHAWPYRDYVIRAFNEDRPYSRFIQEQLAGDVLYTADPQGVVATGFIAAGPWDFVGHVELREGTVDKEKTRLIDRDDMLANAMSTFASLTAHCARCHDHKFDPIPQRDYYQLQAVFAGVDRGDRPLPSPERERQRSGLQQRRETAVARLNDVLRQIDALHPPERSRIDAAINSMRRELASLTPTTAPGNSPTNGYHSAVHSKPDAVAWVQIDLGSALPIDEIRIIPARPTDFPDTPGFGYPARIKVELSDETTFAASDVVYGGNRRDDINHADEADVIRPRGRRARFVRVSASRLWKRSEDYVFALAELEIISGGKNVARGAPVTSLDSIEAGRWSASALVDGFDSRNPRPPDGDPDAERRHELLFRIAHDEVERAGRAEALIGPELRATRDAVTAEIAAIDAANKTLPAPPLVFAAQSHAPRPIRLLRRGDVEQPADAIGPGALSCIPGLESEFPDTDDEGARRRAFASWLANSNNVLTWRSIVNRIWHYHFGRGLVDTPNDFGRNGSRPSHPELLDWLAAEFRAGGQSLKRLHRLIVNSATYRQTSEHSDYAAKVDADNRFLWRMSRRRLDAESIRDAALAVADRLDSRMGGPGFELFRFKDDHSPIYDHDAPDRIDPPEGRRRTVYHFIVRSVPNPFVECLDGADPNAMVPVRNTTISALQALALLNDPFMLSQAEAFANRVQKASSDPSQQVDITFRLAFGRHASDEELESLAPYVRKHGLPNLCRLIYNMSEFLFID